MRILRSPHAQCAVAASLIAVLMILPGSAFPPMKGWLPPFLEQWSDKLAHVGMFWMLTLLLTRSLTASGRLKQPVVLAVLSTAGYVLALEAAQILVPGRHWDLADLAADLLGVALAVPLLGILANNKMSESRPRSDRSGQRHSG